MWPGGKGAGFVARKVLYLKALGRVLLRRELWNGNREPWRNLFVWNDKEQNILLWSWQTHGPIRERYGAAIGNPEFAHLDFVRLRSRSEAEAFVEELDGVSR